jgi:hypothetical protein
MVGGGLYSASVCFLNVADARQQQQPNAAGYLQAGLSFRSDEMIAPETRICTPRQPVLLIPEASANRRPATAMMYNQLIHATLSPTGDLKPDNVLLRTTAQGVVAKVRRAPVIWHLCGSCGCNQQ